jgi:hypothetical protein
MRKYTVDSDEDNPVTIFILLLQQRAAPFSLDAIFLVVDILFMTIEND